MHHSWMRECGRQLSLHRPKILFLLWAPSPEACSHSMRTRMHYGNAWISLTLLALFKHVMNYPGTRVSQLTHACLYDCEHKSQPRQSTTWTQRVHRSTTWDLPFWVLKSGSSLAWSHESCLFLWELEYYILCSYIWRKLQRPQQSRKAL